MAEGLHAVICVLNSKYIHSSLAPWCLLAGVKKYCLNGVTADVVEGTVNEKTQGVAERICAFNPQVVGFSCYIWNIAATVRLIGLVKDRLPDVTIVLGGPEVGFRAGEVLEQYPDVDFVIAGEGEKPFALLLNVLFREDIRSEECGGSKPPPYGDVSGNQIEPMRTTEGRPYDVAGGCAEQIDGRAIDNRPYDKGGEIAGELSDIPGLCYRMDGKIVVSEPFTPADEPESPYSERYFKAISGRIVYLESSRGCPFSCAFCLSGRCGGVRFFDLDETKQKMLLLANSGVGTVKFVDRTFNVNRARANEIFRFVIEQYGEGIPKGVCFHFEIAGDILDSETLELLGRAPAGSIQLEIGLQSFNEKTLSAINRKTDTERLKQNIQKLCEQGNIHIHIDLIAGLPFEDFASFKDSFDTAYSLKPHMLQLGFLKLLHGAPMREDPERFPCEYEKSPPYEVRQTPWISSEELVALHHAEDALDRLYGSGRFRRTLDYLLSVTGLRPSDLFLGFGEFAAEQGVVNCSLDEYTALVYSYFSHYSGVDHTVLRDKMVCDRIATNATGRLPKVLQRYDPALKRITAELMKSDETCPKPGVKRGVAILYSENAAVYADYDEKDPVSGEYGLKKSLL